MKSAGEAQESAFTPWSQVLPNQCWSLEIAIVKCVFGFIEDIACAGGC